jgi:hypothetical protein
LPTQIFLEAAVEVPSMEARQEIKITVKANYRDIVKAIVIEAARLLYKRGVDVKGFKARVKLAQDEVKMPKLIVSFIGEETVELMISAASPIEIETEEKEAISQKDQPASEPDKKVEYDTGMYEHLGLE